MTKNAKDGRERIHLLVPSKTKILLDDLQERTGAGSMTEVFRYALALYDKVSQAIDEGKEVIIRDPNEEDQSKAEKNVVFLLNGS